MLLLPMKKLILIRHGEAIPKTTPIEDFDRDLTDTGKQQSAQMAARLLNSIPTPNMFVSSPAIRALNTAHIFAATFGFDEPVINPKIYEADAETLLKIVNQLNNDFEQVCLTGHNPGISNLLYYLTGKITTMATSAWAEIELNAENWAKVSIGTGTLLQYQQP